MATHKVTAPLVVVKLQSGRFAHVYAGGLVPDDADGDHVEQLMELGMVAASAPTAEAVGESGSEEITVPEGTEVVTPDGERPAGNASRETWHAYALDRGHTEEELEDLSRDDIRELFD